MGLSPGLEYERALILDNHLRESEIFDYLDNLDLTDKLLIRDTYYLFCGGSESKGERAISKILKKGGLNNELELAVFWRSLSRNSRDNFLLDQKRQEKRK